MELDIFFYHNEALLKLLAMWALTALGFGIYVGATVWSIYTLLKHVFLTRFKTIYLVPAKRPTNV